MFADIKHFIGEIKKLPAICNIYSDSWIEWRKEANGQTFHKREKKMKYVNTYC